jgi:hypothetical protein
MKDLARLDSLTVVQLKKLPAYKKLPPSERKSRLKKERLVRLIKVVERAMEEDKQFPRKEQDLRWVLHDLEFIERYNCRDTDNMARQAYSSIQNYKADEYFLANEFRGEKGCVDSMVTFYFENSWTIDYTTRKSLAGYIDPVLEDKMDKQRGAVTLKSVNVDKLSSTCRPSGRLRVMHIRIINVTDLKGHALVAIIDKKLKECEIFDPTGAIGEGIYIQDKIIPELRTRLNLRNYNIFTTGNFCPVGPQSVYSAPVCNMYSFLYAWLRIRNPTVPRKDLIELYVSRTKSNMKDLISNWQCYMVESLDDTGAWDLLADIYLFRQNLKNFKLGNVGNKISDALDSIYRDLVNTGDVETAKRAFSYVVDNMDKIAFGDNLQLTLDTSLYL